MKPLKVLRTAVALHLRRSNTSLTVLALNKASACVAHLQLQGSNVHTVIVRHDHVTVEIDKPSAWLRGGLHIKRINGRYAETVKVAVVLGCQVQWVERELLIPSAKEG
jgi:hypothetical protein